MRKKVMHLPRAITALPKGVSRQTVPWSYFGGFSSPLTGGGNGGFTSDSPSP
jgi:hypothetical protein